jgi:two-component system, OmpR family, sensor histidine kinase KdpD
LFTPLSSLSMIDFHEVAVHLAGSAETETPNWRHAWTWLVFGSAGRHGPIQTRPWIGGLVWLVAWLVIWLAGGQTDVLNLTMVAVMASALSALWLPPWWALLSSLVSGVVFNYVYVPPRGEFALALDQHHALLLCTVVGLSWIIAWLTAQQRQLAVDERIYALRAEQLQGLGDMLRDAEDPRACASALHRALSVLVGQPASLRVAPLAVDSEDQGVWLGEVEEPVRTQLMVAAGEAMPEHPEESTPPMVGQAPVWYLPMRGKNRSFGAVGLPIPVTAHALSLRSHAQAMCDQLGLALERFTAMRVAAVAEKDAHAQQLRNTLLTAISHDYRTPLATILGAATSLTDQADRLNAEQRDHLLGVIVDEAEQLNRVTSNTLQLARLDSPGLHLNLDWESAEEIVGAVLRRARQRNPHRAVMARVDPSIPLVRCDAVLLAQMLDNLVDNALTHGQSDQPVEMVAACEGDALLLAVRDRGRGVPEAWRERIFEMFERVGQAGDMTQLVDPGLRRGAGLGLAVCRTIARVHGGELSLRSRLGGGSSLECRLPLGSPPSTFSVSGWGEP